MPREFCWTWTAGLDPWSVMEEETSLVSNYQVLDSRIPHICAFTWASQSETTVWFAWCSISQSAQEIVDRGIFKLIWTSFFFFFWYPETPISFTCQDNWHYYKQTSKIISYKWKKIWNVHLKELCRKHQHSLWILTFYLYNHTYHQALQNSQNRNFILKG